MTNISVVSKESHQVLENVNSSKVGLNENSVVVVQVSKDDVASITRENNNALINLRNGEVIVIENYFNAEFPDNSLVFQDDEGGQLYWVKFTNEDGTIAQTILYYPIEEIEPLLYSDNFVGGILPWLLGAGVVGAAAAAGGGGDSTPTPQPVPKPPVLVEAPKVYDDVAPKIGPVLNGESTNDTKPEISGSGAQPGAIIKVYNGDQLIGETVAKADGTWSLTPSVALPDGTYNLTSTQTVNGQESEKSAPTKIIVDTVPPTDITIDDIGENGETNTDQPKISGESEPNTEVKVEIKDKDGNVVDEKTVAVDKDGKWEYIPEKSIDEGKYDVIVTPIDKSGNEGKPEEKEFNVDLTPPDITIDPIDQTDPFQQQITLQTFAKAQAISASENNTVAYIKNQTPTFSGTTKDSVRVEVVIRDTSGKVIASGPATVDTATGKWTFKTPVTLAEGDYKLEATAFDAAGNSKLASTTFGIDITPPKVDIEPIALTNDAVPTFKGKTEDGATQVRVEIKDASGKVIEAAIVPVAKDGSWSYKPKAPLADGNITVEASARDQAGNVSAPAITSTVVDTKDPDITIDPIENTKDTTPTISGTTEKDAVVDVQILDKDGKVVAEGPATVDADGKWTFTPPAELPEGTYTIKAEATDKAGNIGTATADGTLTIDTTAPTETEVTIDPIADTNDTTPAITGKTEEGTTVKVVVKDAAGNIVDEGSATVTGDTWAYTPSKPLVDGDYTVVAEATDAAGNTGKSQPEGFAVDTVAPDLTIDELKPTNDTTPTITGNTEPDTTVNVVIKDDAGKTVSEGTATVDADGKWSYTPDAALPEGNYAIEVTPTDKAGNTGDTETAELEVDTTPPTDITIDPIGGEDYESNESKPEITGKGEPDSKLDIVITGPDGFEETATVDIDANGDWTYTPVVELEEGDYHIATTPKDDAGNVGNTTGQDFVIDLTPPDIDIDPWDDDSNPWVDIDPWGDVVTPASAIQPVSFEAVPQIATFSTFAARSMFFAAPVALAEPVIKAAVIDPSIRYTNDPQRVITGTASRAKEVEVIIKDTNGNVISNGLAVINGNTWSYKPAKPLIDGVYVLEAHAKDIAGNVSLAATLKYGVDTAVPELNVNELLPTNDATPLISGKTEPYSTVDVVIKDGQGNNVGGGKAIVDGQGNWTFTPSTNLPDGQYIVQVTATDLANNKTTDDKELSIDTQAPSAVVIDPINNQTNLQPVISGKAEANSTVQLAIKDANGVLIIAAQVVADKNGNWSYPVANKLPEGNIAVEAKAVDAVGNVGPTSSINFNLDATVPDAPNATFNADGSVVSGTAQALSIVKVKDANNKVIGSTTADASGKYTIKLSPSLNDGQKVNVTATDVAGESAPRQASAPNIQLDAIDNVAKAGIQYEYPVTEKFIKDAISYSWLIGFLGITLGKTKGVTEFTIGSGNVADVQLQVKSASWATLFDSVKINLYKQDSAGKWVLIANDKSSGLFDFIGIFGEYAHVNLDDLSAGKYKVEMSNGSLASLPGFVQTNVLIKETNTSATPVVKSVDEAKGNVITDLDPVHGKDLVVAGAVVKSVDGIVVSGSTVVKGQYGTLTIQANGTYTYKPNTDVKAIGKTDVFKYTLTDPVSGKSDTAELVLQIDSKSGSPLAWSKFTPEANANDAQVLANESASKFNSTYLNDTVSAKGLDKLIYNVLNDNSHSGGNGVDTINDFQLGSNVKIDVSKLISDDATAQNLDKFIFVEKDGNNTKISVDRDGAGTTFSKVDLITINNTDTTLQDLLNKNHLLF